MATCGRRGGAACVRRVVLQLLNSVVCCTHLWCARVRMNYKRVFGQLWACMSLDPASRWCWLNICRRDLNLNDGIKRYYIWGSEGMSWDAKGILEAKVSRDTRCPGQSPSWDGVGCPRTPRFVPGHLRCPRTCCPKTANCPGTGAGVPGPPSWDTRCPGTPGVPGHF